MLQFTGVKKSYSDRRILDIPSIQLTPGIYWLQGPNGSGKTSLLRMLAGILPFEGDIRLQDLSLREQPVSYRRLIGWADAEPLYPNFLTGEDLLRFYSAIRRPTAKETDDLIDRLGVRPWLGSKSATWSAGMCKRVSLLLAFIGPSALITLDEPLVTLDQEGANDLYSLIADRYAGGTSFILSSHQNLDIVGFPGLGCMRKIGIIDQTIQWI